MARNYKTGLIITGDAKGGVKALTLTKKQLADLNNEKKRGTQMAKEFGSSIRGVTGTLLRFAPAISAVGFAAMIKSSIDAADNIQKLSTRLGASTEALSEYRHVAELSGVSFQTLTLGLQRMTRRVSEASHGMGEARGALKELGLSAQELAQLAPEEQFEIIADAIAGVGTESDRVRLAMKLFDSEGVALLQTMTDGAEGIRVMREEARALGKTLSQDQADAAAAANDAMTRLKAAISGTAQQLAVDLAPWLADTVNLFTDVVRESGYAEAALITFGKVASDVAQQVEDAWLGVTPTLTETESKILGLEIQIREAEKALAPLRQALENAEKGGEATAAAAEIYRKQLEALEKEVKGYRAEIDKLKVSQDKDTKATKEQTKAKTQLTTANKKLTESEKWLNKIRQDMKTDADHYLDALDMLMVAAEELNIDLNEQQLILNYLAEKYGDTADAADGFTAALERQAGEAQKAADAIQKEHDRIADTLTDALMRGFEDGKDMAQAFADTLVNMFKTMVLRPVIQPIAGAAAGAVGSFFGMPSVASAGGMGGFDLGGIANFFGMGPVGGITFGGTMAGIETAIALMGQGAFIHGMGALIGTLAPILLPLIAFPILQNIFGDDNANSRLRVWTGDTPQGGRYKSGLFSNEQEWAQVVTPFGVVGAGGRHIGVADDDQIPQEEFDQWLRDMEEFFRGLSQLDEMILDVFDIPESLIQEITSQVEALEYAEERMGTPDMEAWLTQRYMTIFEGIGQGAGVLFKSMVDTAGSAEITEVIQGTIQLFGAIKGYGGLMDDYAEAVDRSTWSLQDFAAEQATVFEELVSNFDGSYDSAIELTNAIQQRYQTELQLLAQIDSVLAGITDTIGGSIERIRMSQMSEEQRYEYLTSQAEGLAASLQSMSDPAEIARTVDEINRLTMQAWGSLSADQQAAVATDFEAFLSDVLGISSTQLEDARDAVVTEHDRLEALIDGKMTDVVTSMQDAADGQQAAAEAQNEAANKQLQAANTPIQVRVDVDNLALEVN